MAKRSGNRWPRSRDRCERVFINSNYLLKKLRLSVALQCGYPAVRLMEEKLTSLEVAELIAEHNIRARETDEARAVERVRAMG